MDLIFVNLADGIANTPNTQRRNIRSHVQRGRGGRKRRPASQQVMRPSPASRSSGFLRCPACLQGNDCHRAHFIISLLPTLDMRQPIWDDLALVKLPNELNGSHRRALHECHRVIRKLLYPPAFCADTEGITNVWMRFILEDEAYLQSALAFTASFADWFAGEPRLSPRALGHLAKAYALISERLGGPGATSKSTIATVTSISLYQRLHRLQSLGRLHFEGLMKILSLRGGMAHLAAEDRAVALKPWGLDLEFALQDGQPVRFNGEHAPSACLELSSSSLSYHEFSGSFPSLDPRLVELSLDMQHFTNILNAVGESNKIDPLDYSQHAQHLLYRLLWFSPLGDSENLPQKERLLHMTLVAFSVTLLPEHGGLHKRFDLLSRSISKTVEDPMSADLQDQEFLLWTLFVSGISVTDSSDDPWLLPLLAATLQKLKLNDWAEVSSRLRAAMWIGALHDASGLKLFELVRNRTDFLH